MPRRVATAVLTGVVAVGLLSACEAGSVDPTPHPTTTLPAGVTVTLTQLRSDVADRQAQVRIRNGATSPLEVGAVRVDDPRFTGPATRVVDRRTTLAPGATVDLRMQLAAVDCTSGDEAPSTVTIEYETPAGAGRSTVDAAEEFPFLAALHHRECIAERAGRVATTGFGAFTPSASGVPASLALVITPQEGDGPGALRIVDVRETNLLTFDGVSGGVLVIDPAVGEVRAGDAARTVVLPILPARCDPHAVQEDKRGTVFGVDVDLDGERAAFTIAASADLRAQLLTWVARWCGYG
ncbi:MAG: hypothetical protein ABS63_00480 [Microbacterium sp. SCN 70-27]|uniref:hypothetical protein n=1 Tax=unclassified Microbacterium TaxID=2609290 RepID=UPI00086BBB4E|nr:MULTISPECIES: hypothetical protein [unclassified Microbacterium]MBN9225563.1 hypothetical protein [Microbacterium sp.]ODT29211.1 MAG: hypothetical protein ABS63_00480 [Microbacterium sp. SCN 70-27]